MKYFEGAGNLGPLIPTHLVSTFHSRQSPDPHFLDSRERGQKAVSAVVWEHINQGDVRLQLRQHLVSITDDHLNGFVGHELSNFRPNEINERLGLLDDGHAFHGLLRSHLDGLMTEPKTGDYRVPLGEARPGTNSNNVFQVGNMGSVTEDTAATAVRLSAPMHHEANVVFNTLNALTGGTPIVLNDVNNDRSGRRVVGI